MRSRSIFKRVISSVLALSLLVLCFAALCMPQITIQAYSASGDRDHLIIQISGQTDIKGEEIIIPYDAEKHGMPFTVVYMINGVAKGSAADISVDLKDSKGLWQSDVNRDRSGNVISYIRPLTLDDFDIYVATSSNYVYDGGNVQYSLSEMTIMPAPLTITARDQTVVYNGETQGPGDTAYEDPAEIAELIDIKGLKGQDSISSLILDGQGKDVGVHDLIPSNAVLNGAKERNYDIKYVNGKLTIGYQVSVTAGAHMTVTGDSGELRQIVPGGNIVPLSFTADEGYYFSKDYSVETKDGIEVTRVSESEIKVSGTPKANIEITLPDAELKETPPVPPEPHVHELTLVEAEEATCTEDGNSAYYVCESCGKWFEDESAQAEITDKSAVIIKALGHEWDKGKVTKEPTETEDGVRTYTCLHDSSHTKTEPIPATGHEHSLTKVEARAATCTEAGNRTYYVCESCGKWFEDESAQAEITDKSAVIIKALGHEWDKGKVTKEPTETEDGIRTYTCLHDNSHTKTEPIPATGHEHSLTKVEARAATCTEAGNRTYYVCESCGRWFEDESALTGITDKSAVIIKALGHKWDSGVVTKAATATKDGIRTYTCLHDSSHTKTEPIPATGRKDSNRSEHTVSPLPDAWVRDEAGWHFRENGVLVKNAWRKLEYNGESYWYLFDESDTMKTGWAEWKGERYYLNPVSDGWMGRMLIGWQEIDGKRYYFETVLGNNQGRMYRSEGTPDGYYVGPDGVWVP